MAWELPRLESGHDTRVPRRDLASELDEEIARIDKEHDRIAVLLSGGLDSAAVLYRLALQVAPDRIVPVTIDLEDDRSRSSANVAERLSTVLAPGTRIVRLSTRDLHTPEWFPQGPRLDAAPAHNDALVRAAVAEDASVILTGDGGDEIFGAPRFLTGRFMRRRRGRALASYIGDTALFSPEAAVKEPMSVVADLLPSSWTRALYRRFAWTEASTSPHKALSGRWHRTVRQWSSDWLESVRHHEESLTSWAELDAWSNVFPMVPPTHHGGVEFRYPLLAGSVISAALASPVEDRYNPERRHAYWRAKDGVLGLFDPGLLDELPTAKQTFNRTLSTIQRLDEQPWALRQVGIFERYTPGQDEIFDPRVFFVETWLREALSRGYTPA